MSSSLPFALCQSLTRLARQLLESERQEARTHVLARGRIYRVTVELTPVPPEQVRDVINAYE
ncbi:hypothetical protein KGQ90_11975 [Modicisalibacter tunisiensis]|uniref:hypothetical protein n=1 Tax=Modicisalibacter tunisiensis TaxID=390637 RepID=UPI001CCEB6CC|nr:hypothetical protein [Modicisalibacter tunisiensis]MBZ9539646.1 hypothetical protein [Modicisalibacter tunisiensis]